MPAADTATLMKQVGHAVLDAIDVYLGRPEAKALFGFGYLYRLNRFI
jgi:hypothetical protein